MSVEVEIASGRLRGIRRPASLAFLGIPYADPPTGDARFAAPRARSRWEGVHGATAAGPIAPQGTVFAPGVAVEGRTESEDCLTLNVFTPECDDGKRPVMVFVHGGAFTVGTAYLPLYDGRVFAEAHDVVMVSVNYRIGVLGFHVPREGTDAAGAVANAGVLDVALALTWVRDNAARFGGDAENVTLFGESAGAAQVTLMMAHPPARGLFRRAIAQSAMDPTRLAAREVGAKNTAAVYTALGLEYGDVAALRLVPFTDVRDAQVRVEAERDGWPHFLPVTDAASLPLAPADAVMESDAPRVPLMIGYNRDEWNLFDAGNVATWGRPLESEDALAAVRRQLGDRATSAERLLNVYAQSRANRGLPSDNRALVRAIRGDFRFRIGSQAMAARYATREPAVFHYLFTQGSPALRGALGACHALELPFVFGTLDVPGQDRFAGKSAEISDLSRTMMQAWASFARRGVPDLPAGEAWPTYDVDGRRTVVFDAALGTRVEEDPFGDERSAFPV